MYDPKGIGSENLTGEWGEREWGGGQVTESYVGGNFNNKTINKERE